jgi:hypothetical protein
MSSRRIKTVMLGRIQGRSFLILLLIALWIPCSPAETDRALEDVFEQAYPVAPNASFSIRNADGSIRIYGADIAEMKVQAIKKAYSAERLSKIAVSVSVQPDTVSIDTHSPPKPKWGFFDRSGTVDYVIILPWFCNISRLELTNGEVVVEGMRGDNVHASLVNGRLFGHNCFTDLHLAVTNGALDVAYDWWEEHRFSVNAEITNGNARAFIPGDASFRLLASSVNGHVASEFVEKQDRQRAGASRIDLMVGGNSETEVKINAINGGIRITEVNP